MSVEMDVPDEALGLLREVFLTVEGTCEAWADEEVVRRILIRGAMDYAKSAGREWPQVQELAAGLREQLKARG